MGGPRKNPNRLRAANASIRDVARRAGVSIATVSRTVNGISTVAPELAERVWGVIREVGYVPNTQARALVSGRSHILGLVVSEITNPFFPELVQEFENLAVEQGYEVFIGSTNHDTARTEALIRRMLQRSVDGVAIMTFGIEEELIQKLVERAFPLVFVDAGPDLPNIRILKVNYGEGIREAVQHLAALGHRQIAFISGPSADALGGGAARCFPQLPWPNSGLRFRPSTWSKARTPWRAESRPANGCWHSQVLPTGIVCSNDMTAIGVLHGLHRTTHPVPLDVSVVGFDDIHLAQFMLPPLTTVQMSCKHLATAAVQALRAGIEPDHPAGAAEGVADSYKARGAAVHIISARQPACPRRKRVPPRAAALRNSCTCL